jgi:hypothetical protein
VPDFHDVLDVWDPRKKTKRRKRKPVKTEDGSN